MVRFLTNIQNESHGSLSGIEENENVTEEGSEKNEKIVQDLKKSKIPVYKSAKISNKLNKNGSSLDSKDVTI
jgi:hypothetical protein